MMFANRQALGRSSSHVIRAGILALGFAGAARASQLSIDSATLSFDPNADTWYVSSMVCNNESGGNSGSLLYELRLVLPSGVYYSIGSKQDASVLYANYCRTHTSMAIDVNTNVPAGTYEISLVVGEYSGGSYVSRDSTTFDRTFIKGGGTTSPPSDICAEHGWYGDGECDDFCPRPDPDCSGSIVPIPTGCGVGMAAPFSASAVVGLAAGAVRSRRIRRACPRRSGS